MAKEDIKLNVEEMEKLGVTYATIKSEDFYRILSEYGYEKLTVDPDTLIKSSL